MESQEKGNKAIQSFRKSWVAYISPFIRLAIFLAISYGCFILPWDNPTWLKYRLWVVGGIAAFGVLVCILTILGLRSLILYTDEDGVWVYSGIFPWSKGTYGVKWQDLDDAIFYQGLFSWIFRTYRVRIGHRFTKESEIILTKMWQGHKAAMHINEEMYRRARSD